MPQVDQETFLSIVYWVSVIYMLAFLVLSIEAFPVVNTVTRLTSEYSKEAVLKAERAEYIVANTTLLAWIAIDDAN